MAFDLDTYRRGAAAVRYDDLDYSAFIDRPLSDGAVRCLRSMSDIESHTVCYLRDLLVTPSHADPDVTTFLTMWAFEEYWHGEALARVLEAHGVPTGPDHIRAVRRRLGWQDRLAPVVQSLTANIVGVDFVAVHMSWGAINEWSTHAAYGRLAEREDHPVLTELLTRIMKQESWHAAFYASQARDRLARSAKARRLTRFALRRFWAPVGTGLLPTEDSRHLMDFLLDPTMAAQLDEKVDRLPGQAGLGLVARAVRRG
jgi:hypothetical protein